MDLLFLETRDRKYDPDVYKMRGIYTVTDQDFDLSQFGLFLQTGTLFMTFHINDMVNQIGRRIMSGDVLELEHLADYEPLNDVPAALKRFFVVADCSRASEGFSATWWPHLWRCRLTPLVDSQEYKDILNNTLIDTDGDGEPDTPLGDFTSNYDKIIEINDAIIKQAETDVPYSGYDVSHLFVKPLNQEGDFISESDPDAGADRPKQDIEGYLTGDGLAPNGWPVVAGIMFPNDPTVGDYCLRTDYLPNRLFRFDGNRGVKVEDRVRTGLTPGDTNQTQLGTFVNNTNTYTWYDQNNQAHTEPEKQSLSQALKPKADN